MLNEIARKMSMYDFCHFARVNSVTQTRTQGRYYAYFVQSVKDRMLERLAADDKAGALRIIASDDHKDERDALVESVTKIDTEIRDIYQLATGNSLPIVEAAKRGYLSIIQKLFENLIYQLITKDRL